MKEPLHIKTYFASSVQAALALARRELGPEAMLLNTRQSPPEARHLGSYEAVFATAPAVESAPASTVLDEQPAFVNMHPEIASLLRDRDSTDLPEYMESLITVDSVLHDVAALVGPPGRGKTTTLVKLAVTHGIMKHKPVRLFSADYLRAGGSLQLRTLAAILGVTFEAFPSPASLENALRHQWPGLTLIDTPGFGPRDLDSAQTLARCLTSQRSKVDIHLCLRADSSATALSRTVDRFACFHPARLIFTGLDETPDTAAAFSIAAQSKIALSFLTNGQSIPEDIEPASAARIVKCALGPQYQRSLVTA